MINSARWMTAQKSFECNYKGELSKEGVISLFDLEPVFKRMKEDNEKYGPLEPGIQQVYILNDCVVVIGLDRELDGQDKLSINIIGGNPAFINHTTGFYEDGPENYKEVIKDMVNVFGREVVQKALDNA